MKFTPIPDWTYTDKTPGALTFFESIALAGLEEKTIRISAKDQRALLGFVVFGKRAIFVRNTGVVESYIKVCFGTDYEYSEYTPQMIKDAILNKKQLCPGR